MVDNTSVASKSALQAAFSAPTSMPSLLVSASSHHSSPFPISRPSQSSQSVSSGGGMRLEAVMENLQRQQAARLALEEKLRQEKDRELRCLVESRIQQQALAIRQYQAAVRAAAAVATVVTSPSPSNTINATTTSTSATSSTVSQNRPTLIYTRVPVHQPEEEEPKHKSDGDDADFEDEDMEDEDGEEEDEEDLEMSSNIQRPDSPGKIVSGVGHSQMPNTSSQSQALSPNGQPGPHEWTYEEQFKQLYELDEDPKRKEFLDDLFSFMQKRGTPVNRIPIMAKQVLDLYTLYRLVTEKGGLVEVINKKIWREITKGLSLPTSITSAAFTLRTQYMKYLYPYECEKRGLSSPGELQAAIDSNRREGRRQGFGSGLFSYSPVGTPNVLTSPKISMPTLSVTTHNGAQISQIIKKEDGLHPSAPPHRISFPVALPGHHAAAAQAVQAMQAAALEQLREKLESGEPPEKKMAMMAEEQQRLMQHALQHNLLAMAAHMPMKIKINNRDDRQETAMNLSASTISSINMSMEINGVVYAGVLFAHRATSTSGSSTSSVNNNERSSPSTAQIPLQSSTSQGHTPPRSSP
ncbi:AT-rich interactive domain-containing protein 3A-like [Bufo gargarizans]|uniref:AT-rich interactive domain-containing protein 3A-like n=1 Tax=Bufo gargarizans TaxID=30331 RepID=UPI001CF194E2|nr:AT-rich interactive domain-containing protein 3A-like [Bufo gargarizans]